VGSSEALTHTINKLGLSQYLTTESKS
ncbi:hypothetical protein LCGC14_1469280, partial [marine sediment metagenome]